MIILAELDLPTLLFGFTTMFATAVAYMYKDMRKDIKIIQDNATSERVKCDAEIKRLNKEIDELKFGPCLKENCPLSKK